MSKLASVLGAVGKSYLYTNLAKDVTRFVRKNLNDVDFDRDEWLHKAGLTSYRPASGFLLVLGGVVAGAAVALMLAPQKGSQLRSEVRERAMTFLGKSEDTKDDVSRRVSRA
jgi:hypothetical protein